MPPRNARTSRFFDDRSTPPRRLPRSSRLFFSTLFHPAAVSFLLSSRIGLQLVVYHTCRCYRIIALPIHELPCVLITCTPESLTRLSISEHFVNDQNVARSRPAHNGVLASSSDVWHCQRGYSDHACHPCHQCHQCCRFPTAVRSSLRRMLEIPSRHPLGAARLSQFANCGNDFSPHANPPASYRYFPPEDVAARRYSLLENPIQDRSPKVSDILPIPVYPMSRI